MGIAFRRVGAFALEQLGDQFRPSCGIVTSLRLDGKNKGMNEPDHFGLASRNPEYRWRTSRPEPRSQIRCVSPESASE